MANAFAPLADAGTVLKTPLRANQFPPKVVHRAHQAGSKCSRKEPVVGDGIPKYGNQLTRRRCEPSGVSVTLSSGFVEATGLTGGSKGCVPRQPIAQSGNCRACA